MSSGFTGEIRMFGGNFAPRGWMSCDGTKLAISQFRDLYDLIGTTYGGDGVQSFQLPDMRGRVPVHAGTGIDLTPRALGEKVGAETVTISNGEMPNHLHDWSVSADGSTGTSPQNAVLATTFENVYSAQPVRLSAMNQNMVGEMGGEEPHSNMMPSVGVQFIICLSGDQPSQA